MTSSEQRIAAWLAETDEDRSRGLHLHSHPTGHTADLRDLLALVASLRAENEVLTEQVERLGRQLDYSSDQTDRARKMAANLTPEGADRPSQTKVGIQHDSAGHSQIRRVGSEKKQPPAIPSPQDNPHQGAHHA